MAKNGQKWFIKMVTYLSNLTHMEKCSKATEKIKNVAFKKDTWIKLNAIFTWTNLLTTLSLLETKKLFVSENAKN